MSKTVGSGLISTVYLEKVIYMVDSHESDAYRQRNDFVAQS